MLEIFRRAPPLLILLSPVKLASHSSSAARMRRLLGGKLKAIICGGGPLPAFLDHFFAAIGVNILEGYGLTEASPIVSMRTEKAPVMGTVGRPLPSTEVRILGEHGELLPPGRKGTVLVKGPQVMQGYYKDAAATEQLLSADGWLDTGDSGILTVDGNLVITGRMRACPGDAFGRAGGAGTHRDGDPGSPYVQEAVLVGDRRESLGLLIVPNMDWLRRFADSRRVHWGDPKDLVGNPAVNRFFQEEVQAHLVNSGVHFPGGTAPRIALLPSAFEVGRELTRTLSKRREVITAMYGGVIEKMYRS